jgi:hypothetical protein
MESGTLNVLKFEMTNSTTKTFLRYTTNQTISSVSQSLFLNINLFLFFLGDFFVFFRMFIRYAK